MKSINNYISLSNERISSIDDYISVLNERISSIDDYIHEKLVLSRNSKPVDKQYLPKTTEELKEIVSKLVDQQSMEDIINLNYIDTSDITDMRGIFDGFEGIIKIDISDWDVSRVINMSYMFRNCYNLEEIIGIDNWDVSKCRSMVGMFKNCESFNGNLSDWNTISLENIAYMFFNCRNFDCDLSKWNTSAITTFGLSFSQCSIKKTNKPKF